ncbi:S41 family peptidase [Algoriphagus namhaensis]|uniref:S41 family peptidase n=1 Tax=Algoriphagus namhaensis TaxID=915353 RepID=A0ABV8AWF9_9BACT
MIFRISLILIFLIANSAISSAQNKGCVQDLEALLEILQDTPSYKDQIKGKDEKGYLSFFEKLKTEASEATTKGECFLVLGNLKSPINDNHLFLSEIPEIKIDSETLQDSVFMEKYKESDAFKNFSRVNTDLDSLELKLEELPENSTEGIYYYGDYAKIGLFQLTGGNYIAAILETKLPHWERGQIAFIAKEFDQGKWNIWNYSLITKSLQFISSDRIVDGTFNRIAWSKFPEREDFTQVSPEKPVFEFNQLNENVQYLRLGTFATSTQKLKESQEFFDQIQDSISAPNLIVDLRNNGGGGSKSSRKFYQMLRKEVKNRKVWVLINQKTASNAEQFTIQIAKFDNLKTLGKTTAGILAYGNNYGKSETLPSGRFQIYITDMADSGGYLAYESIGVQPEIPLEITSDWVDQTLQIIAASEK